MPIEIRELHIKINVSESSSGSAPAGDTGDSAAAGSVAECVEQVMEALKKQKER